jgi:hypothetical protein
MIAETVNNSRFSIDYKSNFSLHTTATKLNYIGNSDSKDVDISLIHIFVVLIKPWPSGNAKLGKLTLLACVQPTVTDG